MTNEKKDRKRNIASNRASQSRAENEREEGESV